MRVADEFDAWAAEGRDRGMAQRHWNTAKHALARMPVEPGDAVLDLGTGSGYALRALRETRDIGRGYGLDGSGRMLQNARSYTEDDRVGYLAGEFTALPVATDGIDHAFSMEAFYYSPDPARTLAELRRVLRPGGTFHCAVNYFAESEHTHGWADHIDVEMTLWDRAEYRDAFRAAGFTVALQDTIPDRDVEIPPSDAFPTDGWASREAMIDRYRTWGTLVTVGVSPPGPDR